MYTAITYQDWVAALAQGEGKGDLIRRCIESYRTSDAWKMAKEGSAYASSMGMAIDYKRVLRGGVIRVAHEDGYEENQYVNSEIVGNRVGSNFFYRAVVQQNQFLLGNGVTLKDETQKAKLGFGADTAIAHCGKHALMHGVCWAFYNLDHIDVIPAYVDAYSGCFALLDEMSSLPMVGIQFWRLGDNKPLCVRVFEMNGYTMWREENGEAEKDKLLPQTENPIPYIVKQVTDDAGIVSEEIENYSMLPLVPFYANEEKRGELTPAIKSKIDLYNNILSDFGDNLDRANDVYWVLNNFGGGINGIANMLEQIHKLKAVVNVSDGSGTGSTAEPRTIEVPYAARQTALELLEKAMYKDYMALDLNEITGGSLTNVAIEAAMVNLNLKADQYEWQAFQFVQKLLKLSGVETEEIKFKRQSITNRSEIVQDIYLAAADLDRETRLKLNPYIEQEDIANIMARLDEEETVGLSVDDEEEEEEERDDA